MGEFVVVLAALLVRDVLWRYILPIVSAYRNVSGPTTRRSRLAFALRRLGLSK